MKKNVSILVSILFLILGIISCDTNNELEPDFISAKINEENWNGFPEININNVNDTLTLLGVGNEKVIAFKIKYSGEGVYNLTGTQANYYTTIGGDVITSVYTLGESTSSQITITEYNSEQNIIKGNFEISLLKAWSNPENNTNSLSFTRGQFKGTITE